MRGIDASRLKNVVLNPYDYNHIFVLGNDDGIAFLSKPNAVSDGCRAPFGFGPRKLTPEEKVARRSQRSRLKWERKQERRMAEKARKGREVARAAARSRSA